MSSNSISNLPVGPSARTHSASSSALTLTDVLRILGIEGTNPQVLAALALRLGGVLPEHCPNVHNRDRSGVQRLPVVPKMGMGGHF